MLYKAIFHEWLPLHEPAILHATPGATNAAQ